MNNRDTATNLLCTKSESFFGGVKWNHYYFDLLPWCSADSFPQLPVAIIVCRSRIFRCDRKVKYVHYIISSSSKSSSSSSSSTCLPTSRTMPLSQRFLLNQWFSFEANLDPHFSVLRRAAIIFYLYHLTFNLPTFVVISHRLVNWSDWPFPFYFLNRVNCIVYTSFVFSLIDSLTLYS